MSVEVRAGTHTASFDVTGDGLVTADDRDMWVRELRKTWFGDSNNDGLFTSSDFVFVFTKGEYEDTVAGNSTWADGDWNGDGEFSSSDFVTAFVDGGFEMGARGAVAAVPEPSSMTLVVVALFMVARRHRR